MAYPAENAFHRIPQWWKVENLLVNVSWFDAAFTGDIDFAEAIENVDSVDGPNLVNNLGSPLFQYSYWFGCDCFTFPRHPATPPEKVWYEILHTHTHPKIYLNFHNIHPTSQNVLVFQMWLSIGSIFYIHPVIVLWASVFKWINKNHTRWFQNPVIDGI